MESQSLKKTVNWFAAVAWMVVIFGFSDQNADLSSQMSGSFVQLAAKCICFVKGLLFHDPGTVDLELLTYLVRKGAHLFLYLVLGILICRALHPEGQITLRIFVLTVLICFAYACSDEIHQLFQSGRSCEFRDMLIDTSGAAIGVGLYALVKSVRHTPE